jgi:hypothetical protein
MNERNYTVPISNGLLEPKHYRAIRDALWLFFYMVDKQTRRVDDNGHGKVSGGKPIRDKDIAGAIGCSRQTVIRWRDILVCAGYITAKRTPYGFVYAIPKPKKWQQNSPPSPARDVTQTGHLSQGNNSRDVRPLDQRCTADRTNKEDVTRDYSRSSTNSAAAVSISPMENKELQAVWKYYLDASGGQEYPNPSKGKMGLAIIRKLHEKGYPHPVLTMTAAIDMAKHLATTNPKKVDLFKWTSMFSKWDTAKSLWLEYMESNPPDAATLPAEFQIEASATQ